jgi:hypothetical protein
MCSVVEIGCISLYIKYIIYCPYVTDHFLTDHFIRCQQLYVLLVSSASVLCLLKDYGNDREKEQFKTNFTLFSVVKQTFTFYSSL